ncbi:MAG: TonB-dependent receptor [Sphingomonas bacterium]|nr:TonB-dependent receptor [Sphingomonas bacterium]MDB5689015.1 TonB-dependent receptor [Sphingomonas bacterium]
MNSPRGASPDARRFARLNGVSRLILTLALGLSAGPLSAQTTEPGAPPVPSETDTATAIETRSAGTIDNPAAAGTNDGTIVVTGSRIARSGFTAPTPLTTLGAGDLENRAATNIADVLTVLPSFASGTTPNSTNHTSISSGANLVDLRGLGTTRTLVLVDGRRFIPSTIQGRIDLNAIPASLIERAEVVTGGASAAWGSDAIAGVVNLIFKKKQTGIEGSIQYGISDYNDGKQYRAALNIGTNFADDRGNVVIAGEFDDNHGVGPFSSRKELLTKWQVIANPTYRLGNGQAQSYLTDNVNISQATLGGLITGSTTRGGQSSTLLRGTQFLPGGVPAPFQFGSMVGTQYMVGGSGAGDYTMNQLGTLQVPVRRWNIYGRASFEVSDSLTVFGEVSYADSYSKFRLTTPLDLGTIRINADNPFIAASVRDAMTANNLASFQLGRISPDGFWQTPINKNKLQRYMVGAEGKVFGDWKWSAYLQTGRDDYREDVLNNRKNANFQLAVDAVINPANGQIVCRSTLTNPGNGCVPINLFGVGSPSQAALAYSAGTSWQDAFFKETSGAIDLNGSPFSLWAGEVSVAVGAEWRKDSAAQTVDPLSATSGWNIHNPKALTGKNNVKELYGEIVVPLLKDVPLVQSLDLNGAVRYTDYSTSGGVTSWKVGATWEVSDFLRLRATKSRDIRAPALGELFASAITQSTNVIDPTLGNIQYTTLAPQTGNANLVPEIGDTWTAGAVIRPFRGFSASVDYFNIKLDDAIGLPAVTDILDGCYKNNIQTYCDLITRDTTGASYAGAGRISQILRQYINQGQFKEVGIDFEVSYNTSVEALGFLDGNFNIRLLATWIDKLEQIYNGVTTDQAGAVGGSTGMPKWRGNLSVNYDQGPVGLFAEGRYIGGGVRSNLTDAAGVPTITRLDGSNNISDQWLLNLGLQYTLRDYGQGKRIQLYFNVRNALDKIQVGNPFAFFLSTTGAQGLYDILGRSYSGGVRFKF